MAAQARLAHATQCTFDTPERIFTRGGRHCFQRIQVQAANELQRGALAGVFQ